MATSVFINEFHYDNDGTDTGEAIEIAGSAGTELNGWSIFLYNGVNGSVYTTTPLGGTIPNQQNGFGTVSVTYPSNGIQNGAPDGIALVDNNNNVVQFLSYEGSFTATDGPAAGLTSTDIGFAEGFSTPAEFSLQLTGSGTTYEEFTWTERADDNFGSVNSGQSFGVSDTPIVTIQATDSDAAEANQAPGTFTITRTGDTSTALTVEYAVATGTAQATNSTDYTPNLSKTATIAAGQSSVNITIIPVDDNDVEGNETVTLNLVDRADYDLGGSNSATVTISDNDVALTSIYKIQGAGQISPFADNPFDDVNGQNQAVTTTGIVTAVDSNGFYLQDPTGDGNVATSDGIFAFTRSAPSVKVGDQLQVEGTVSEFVPGGLNTGNLSTTQITSPTITTLSTGNSLPDPVILGVDRTPPTQIIDNDNLTSYDPTQDGIDFYESLEGMRVTVNNALAVSPTNRFGEIFTVANNGENATGLSDRGTINIDPDDFNPERVQIQFDSGILPGFEQQVNVGAELGDVTGIVGYNFGNYEVNVTETFTPVESSELQPETTNLVSTEDQLTVASYNVLNLDPNDADGDQDIANGQFEAIANQIVNNLKAPDIIGLQEIQDNDGSVNSNIVDASLTYQTLIDAIVAAGGPRYEFLDIPPVDDQSGGQPGGNIRVGYLYDPERVDFVEGSLERIEDPNLSDGNAFEDSRNPLAATFLFNGQEVTLVNNHFTSKGGSTPLFGAVQPPVNGGEQQRIEQAQVVENYVNDILGTNANANVAVLGDLNSFEFEAPLEILEEPLNNLTETLPPDERYSYIFQGNSQSLDHILASNSLFDGAEFDAVHVNSEFVEQTSDHDPLLARFTIEKPEGVELRGGNGAETLTGGLGDDRLFGKNAKDTLFGLAGDDYLVGDNGKDLLQGGTGDDTLLGGNGSDTFVLAASEGTDTITDFIDRLDLIGLSEVLTFEQLTITQGTGINANNTLLSSSGEILAILTGVESSNITSADFITI